jgi:tetratricopeptide (TPR) repeat protein
MKSVNKIQIAVIAGSILLVVLLLFANTKLPLKQEAETADQHDHANEGVNILDFVGTVKANLPEGEKQEVKKLEAAITATTDKKSAYEAIINFYDNARQPILAAYYMEQAAIASPIDSNWTYAGARYYSAIQFSKPTEHPMLYKKAIECFEKTLSINPKNLDARISLAACYVEGSADPMKGIGMLREIEKTDSNNVNLQLNFAFFSERSGQWDKAIARFEKVLKIKPDFIEAFLHIADAYEQKGDKKKAIEYLEKYKAAVDDVSIKTEVQNYINKLAQ